jgi:hypothetical protein
MMAPDKLSKRQMLKSMGIAGTIPLITQPTVATNAQRDTWELATNLKSITGMKSSILMQKSR